MADLEKYIEERKTKSEEFAKDFEKGYDNFRIGYLLKQARKSAGITQEELANKLKTKKSAISRIVLSPLNRTHIINIFGFSIF